MTGGNVIGGVHLKEAVNQFSVFEPQGCTGPRLMLVQKAFDSAEQSFVFIFLVRSIITFSDAWTATWMYFMINGDYQSGEECKVCSVSTVEETGLLNLPTMQVTQ